MTANKRAEMGLGSLSFLAAAGVWVEAPCLHRGANEAPPPNGRILAQAQLTAARVSIMHVRARQKALLAWRKVEAKSLAPAHSAPGGRV
jgi:hypothetical protein